MTAFLPLSGPPTMATCCPASMRRLSPYKMDDSPFEVNSKVTFSNSISSTLSSGRPSESVSMPTLWDNSNRELNTPYAERRSGTTVSTDLMPMMHTCMRHMGQTTSVAVHGSPVAQFVVPNAMCFPPTHRIAACVQIRAAKLKPEPAPTLAEDHRDPHPVESTSLEKRLYSASSAPHDTTVRICESTSLAHLPAGPYQPWVSSMLSFSADIIRQPPKAMKGYIRVKTSAICQPLSIAKM
mmetsp:Transcript_9981/g.27937  ORF Transcript_9981/g.27937 Transcript_9981/m.27937 type:complete len:239 (+) Transcript_9981:2416-3132(+)